MSPSALSAYENPVLAHVVRGGRLESQHRGSVVIVRGREVVFALGDATRPVFARSAVKAFQAVAALRADVATRFGLGPVELALMCASHNGEPEHVAVAAGMLAKGGLTADDLRCGTHPPYWRKAADDLVRVGVAPTALHNNCSGKHAGMLLFCRAIGAPTERYIDPEHPIQLAIRDAVRRTTDTPEAALSHAIDGCSAPTWILPLANLALGFARLANPTLADAADREALTRLRDAQAAHPEMIGGTRRFDTDFIRAGAGRLFSKIGAEGILACGVRGLDLGIAIKIDDGNERPYVPILLTVLRRLGVLSIAETEALSVYLDTRSFNHAGIHVGHIDVTFEGP